MRDPYEIMGVSKNSDDKAIKSAYRKLARENHPDLHPNDKAAENGFKEIRAAYELLKDEEKRAAYERGEIDPDGTPRRSQTFHRTCAAGAPDGKYHDPREIFRNFGGGEIFADLYQSVWFGGRTGGAVCMRGADERYSLDVDFLDAVKGSMKHVSLPEGKRFKVKIPLGSDDGQILRLKGRGGPGLKGGAAGDPLIELHVWPHPAFDRQWLDILLELPVVLHEAVLCSKPIIQKRRTQMAITLPDGDAANAAP